MEDDNGLDLSLGLPCGGDTTAAKGKSGSTSDSRSDINDRDTKVINEFKQFLDGGTMQMGQSMVSQSKPENFFNNLSKNPVDADTSKNLNSGGFWITSDRSAEGREDRADVREKRKGLFAEGSQSKKHEKETDRLDLQEKSRASHISINTDDGSTADNEDVADSEAETSTSRHLLQQDDVAKRHIASSHPEVNKDYHGISHSNALELSGQRRFTISSEKEFKHGNLPHGVQFANQSINIINMSRPLSITESNTNSLYGRPGYPLPGVMQVMGATNSERSGSQPVMPANIPLAVGYPSVQLPPNSENPRMIVSHHQQIHPSYISRGPPNSDKHNDDLKITQGMRPKSAESKQLDGKPTDYAIGNAKQLAEAGTSRAEDDKKGAFRPKDATETPRTEVLPSEYPTIKPGIAAELKFGGSGSYPNLPWVSTTGSGPNGRTISGVTYRYSPTQIRIVCACHGTHMSPEEFVRHASEEQTNQETGATSVPTTNPAASAQS